MKGLLPILLLAAAPVMADETITFENRSARVVEGISTYPVGADGRVVDDNIGAVVRPLAPGARVALGLALSRCGMIEAYVHFADGEEVRGRTDLCRNRTLIITD